ncbi:MAG: GLPGLI family protein [Prevotellaceae bacterium]|jgi:GLPGLI family protein|nr:GLPGLI family protein [Prevotellaceae bacterium]
MNIRKIFIITFCLSFIYSISAAQTTDSASLICLYNAKYINDMQNPQKIKNEEMILLVGEKYSSFYSYTNFVVDSLQNANPIEYMPQAVVIDGGRRHRPPQKRLPQTEYFDRFYIERSSGNLHCLTQILGRNYQYNEHLTTPEWNIMDVTLDILGYRCQKATANYKGRNWIVWFTHEIPISEGVWKLRGLPGLILKAEDSEKHYSFECTGIERLTPPRPIVKNNSVIYQTVSKKDYDELYKTFFNNPSAYLEHVLGGKISITSDKKREYNPIER